VLVKAAHQVDPRVTRDPQIRNSPRRFILRTAPSTQPLRGERAGTCRTDQKVQKLVHRLEDCVNERSHPCRNSDLTKSIVQQYHDSGTLHKAMIFKLNPAAGQALYLQIVQQVMHAVESGVLRPGDQLPGIRPLAEELVVSHNTVAKAYSELEHEGLLELRHGSGAFIADIRRHRPRTEKIGMAKQRVNKLVESLQREGLSADEIRRLF